MPVLSVLLMLFDYLSFTQLSGWHLSYPNPNSACSASGCWTRCASGANQLVTMVNLEVSPPQF